MENIYIYLILLYIVPMIGNLIFVIFFDDDFQEIGDIIKNWYIFFFPIVNYIDFIIRFTYQLLICVENTLLIIKIVEYWEQFKKVKIKNRNNITKL